MLRELIRDHRHQIEGHPGRGDPHQVPMPFGHIDQSQRPQPGLGRSRIVEVSAKLGNVQKIYSPFVEAQKEKEFQNERQIAGG